MRSLRIISILCLTAFVVCKKAGDGPSGTGNSASAGIKVRLTQKAFDYCNTVFDEVLQQSLPNAPLPNVEQTFVGGNISLYNLCLKDYKRPDSYTTQLQPPNKIAWSLQRMNIGIKGKFDINYALQKGSGDLNGLATDLSLSLQLALTAENRILKVKPTDCKATVKNLNFDITTDNKNLQVIFDLNKPTLILLIKAQLQKELCNQFRQIVSVDVNKQLSKAGSKIQLSESTKTSNSSASTKTDSAVKIPPEVDSLLKQLYLDYGLVKDPVVNKDYMDVYSRGEISYMGQGGTPFDPTPLPDAGPTDRMISVLISDFVANSMFYHAFQHKLLRFRINAENYPSVAKFLSVGPCAQDECLGSIIPTLKTAYPNAKMEIQAEATDTPKITITSGNANIVLKGILTLLATKSEQSSPTELVKAELNANANCNLLIEDSALKGSIKINTLALKLISNSNFKDVDQAKLDSWSQQGKQWLESAVGIVLDIGLPLPLSKHGKLVQPRLSLNNGFIQLDTDVEVNKTALIEQVKKRMEESGHRVIKMKLEL